MKREEVIAIIKEHLMDNLEDLDEGEFDPARSMKEMGANSLDIVEVVSCTMRQLKVKIPRSELANLENIDQLADMLVQAVQAKAVA